MINLRIETGGHCVQKFLKTPEYVKIVYLMYVEKETRFRTFR